MPQTFTAKLSIIRSIQICTVGFCLTKIFRYGLVNNLGDEFISAKLNLFAQSMDFLWFGIVLIACHPRKEWPPFFTLAVNDVGALGRRDANGQAVRAPQVPLLSGQISKQLLCDPD